MTDGDRRMADGGAQNLRKSFGSQSIQIFHLTTPLWDAKKKNDSFRISLFIASIFDPIPSDILHGKVHFLTFPRGPTKKERWAVCEWHWGHAC
jgi:hypothetical protein